MFDAHPPFQIDGNFGGANGMMEMLLQCVDGEIELLPALPRAWSRGSVRGLRARGGFEIDMRWRDGELESARIRGAPGGAAKIRYRETVKTVRAAKGRAVDLTAASFR
jgi:alpha-L-fucosidase 2